MAKQNSEQSGQTVVDDGTLNQFLGYHIKRAGSIIQSDLSNSLKPFDLRMLTYTALVLIIDNPGLSQSQLADAMGIERPNLVVVIDELERRALIERKKVPTDRRVYALTPTQAGRDLCEQALEADKAREARLFGQIDETTKKQLIDALSQIRRPKDS